MKKNRAIFMISTFILLTFGCNRQVDFPASLMEMNKPEYLLKDSDFWDKIESEHFICYSSKKINSHSMVTVIENQEKNLLHIAQIMKVYEIDTLPKINLWIFKNDREKYLKTQVKTNAHSLTEYWSAYYNKGNATGAHEIGHLMSNHFWGYLDNKKYSFLLEEGFCFYVDEGLFFKIDFYKKAKKLVKNDNYKLSNIIEVNNNNNYEEKAFVCGAFDKYLITKYGIEKFSALWKNSKSDNPFNSTYGKSLADLEKEFYIFLDSYNK